MRQKIIANDVNSVSKIHKKHNINRPYDLSTVFNICWSQGDNEQTEI